MMVELGNETQELAAGEPTLELYIAGDNINSRRAVANLDEVVKRLGNSVKVVIIDVLKEPKIAFTRRIFVTPSLIYTVGDRQTLVLGDLSDVDRVSQRLSR